MQYFAFMYDVWGLRLIQAADLATARAEEMARTSTAPRHVVRITKATWPFWRMLRGEAWEGNHTAMVRKQSEFAAIRRHGRY